MPDPTDPNATSPNLPPPPPPGGKGPSDEDIDAILNDIEKLTGKPLPPGAASGAGALPEPTPEELAALLGEAGIIEEPAEPDGAAGAAKPPLPPPPPGSAPMELPAFDGGREEKVGTQIDLLYDVALNVKIELGRSRMSVEDILKLGKGSVVELDKLAGDPLDVFMNERLVARGEVLILNDNFCIRITEIVAPKERGAR